MQINYLCPKHADWVYNNPEQALHVMARDEMQGTMLMQSGQFSEAIPYLGCAFDIAVILLEVDGGENSAMTAKIMGLTSLLKETYFHLKLPHHRNAIVDRAHTVISASNNIVNSNVPLRFAV